MRPKTAATTTKKDEGRIKSKLMALEKIERKIEFDIEEFQSKRDGKGEQEAKGIKVSKQLILEYSQCDTLDQV